MKTQRSANRKALAQESPRLTAKIPLRVCPPDSCSIIFARLAFATNIQVTAKQPPSSWIKPPASAPTRQHVAVPSRTISALLPRLEPGLATKSALLLVSLRFRQQMQTSKITANAERALHRCKFKTQAPVYALTNALLAMFGMKQLTSANRKALAPESPRLTAKILLRVCPPDSCSIIFARLAFATNIQVTAKQPPSS
jgi:hypothetical protein